MSLFSVNDSSSLHSPTERLNDAFFFVLFLAVVSLTTNVVFSDNDSDESKAIEKIELLGGEIERDEKLPGRPVVGVSFVESKKFNRLS